MHNSMAVAESAALDILATQSHVVAYAGAHCQIVKKQEQLW